MTGAKFIFNPLLASIIVNLSKFALTLTLPLSPSNIFRLSVSNLNGINLSATTAVFNYTLELFLSLEANILEPGRKA